MLNVPQLFQLLSLWPGVWKGIEVSKLNRKAKTCLNRKKNKKQKSSKKKSFKFDFNVFSRDFHFLPERVFYCERLARTQTNGLFTTELRS